MRDEKTETLQEFSKFAKMKSFTFCILIEESLVDDARARTKLSCHVTSSILKKLILTSPLIPFLVAMETPVYMNGTYSISGKKISLKRLMNHKQELEKEISSLEKLQKTLLQQRQDLQFLNESIKGWAQVFDKIERNTQGVPFVRNVKEICAQIENHLNDIHGDFYFRMQNLVTADVPCFQQVYEALELLKKQVSKILNDDAAYKASFIEEIRQLLGRLTGVTDTMLEIYFDE